jgi:hypothetical protein
MTTVIIKSLKKHNPQFANLFTQKEVFMKKSAHRLLSFLCILALTQMVCSCSVNRKLIVRGYEDINGNGKKEENEPWLEGISITWLNMSKNTDVNGIADFPEQNFNSERQCRSANFLNVQTPPEYRMTQRPFVYFDCYAISYADGIDFFDGPTSQTIETIFGLQKIELVDAATEENPVPSAPTSTPIVPAPSLSLEKTVDHNACTAAGEKFSYTYTFTNTGNMPLTGPFTLTDDKIFSFTCEQTLQNLALQPNESAVCYGVYLITEQEYKSGATIHNEATVSAFFEEQKIVSNTAKQDVVCYPKPKDPNPEPTEDPCAGGPPYPESCPNPPTPEG